MSAWVRRPSKQVLLRPARRNADSMGEGFKVEISELDDLVRERHWSQDEMRSALNALCDTGPKTTGSKELDNACDEFHDSWDDAITKITEGTQAIENGLKKTRDTPTSEGRNHHMGTPPVAPDVAQVLKHNRTLLYRHIATRLTLAAVLFSVPYMALQVGYNAALPAFGIPAALFVLIFLTLRLRHGSRLKVCEKVLRTYPLEYRTRVTKKDSDWKYLGGVHTVRLSVRGQHGAPYLRAINASTVRRWPKEAEEGGAWFAGDVAFGGVMVVPRSNDMLFVQPSDWEKYEQERAEADPQRRALAEQAGISGLLEKEPNIRVYG